MAIVGLTAVGAVTFAALAETRARPLAPTARTPDDPVWVTLLAARQGTAKYRDVNEALRDGYHRVSACVMSPDGGVMGIHYLNDAYAKDPRILAAMPELLLYLPIPDGSLKLVAVEYWRADADQDLSTDFDRPVLARIPFQGRWRATTPACRGTTTWHVWVWAWNAAGVFAQFNPSLHC